MTVPVARASTGQAAAVAALIAEAFVPIPPCVWLVDDPVERRRRLEAAFVILVEHAFEHGHVEIAGDLAGAAVWFHSLDAPPPPDYDARLAAAAGPHLARFQAVDAAFEAHHPHGRPHHHLAFLAVQPSLQNQGTGSVLLEAHHRRLDSLGTGAYLEASTPRSRDLYLRHGYEPMGDPFHLPDGPPFWPMWRAPAG